MDPETGAVLALASSPTYNAADVESLIKQTDSASGSELYNRATQALYAPGSTFKMVTLSTALQDGVTTEETEYQSPGVMEIGNAKVSNCLLYTSYAPAAPYDAGADLYGNGAAPYGSFAA